MKIVCEKLRTNKANAIDSASAAVNNDVATCC